MKYLLPIGVLALLTLLVAFGSKPKPQPKLGATANVTCTVYTESDIYDTPSGTLEIGYTDASTSVANYGASSTPQKIAHVIGHVDTCQGPDGKGGTVSTPITKAEFNAEVKPGVIVPLTKSVLLAQ